MDTRCTARWIQMETWMYYYEVLLHVCHAMSAWLPLIILLFGASWWDRLVVSL